MLLLSLTRAHSIYLFICLSICLTLFLCLCATCASNPQFTTPSWTTEELLETAASVGVRRAVLISHGGIYGFDNSYMIESARAYPEQLRVVGAIDVDTLTPAEVEAAMWELLPQRVTGFRTYPAQNALPLCLYVFVFVCVFLHLNFWRRNRATV